MSVWNLTNLQFTQVREFKFLNVWFFNKLGLRLWHLANIFKLASLTKFWVFEFWRPPEIFSQVWKIVLDKEPKKLFHNLFFPLVNFPKRRLCVYFSLGSGDAISLAIRRSWVWILPTFFYYLLLSNVFFKHALLKEVDLYWFSLERGYPARLGKFNIKSECGHLWISSVQKSSWTNHCN